MLLAVKAELCQAPAGTTGTRLIVAAFGRVATNYLILNDMSTFYIYPMRTISKRQLQRHLFTELKNLPVIIANRKTPIAVITSIKTNDMSSNEDLEATPTRKPLKELIQVKPISIKESVKAAKPQLVLQPFTMCKKHKVFISSCGCKPTK